MKKPLNVYRIDFLDYLHRFRGYSDLTLKTYDEAVSEALRYIEVEENGGLNILNLMPYRLHISSLKSKTIAKKISAVRSFAEYMKEQGENIRLLADESIKVPKTLPKPIPHEYIKEALGVADLREKVVVILLYTLGLRISELSALKLEDITKEWVRVRGKGGKVRDIPLMASSSELVAFYRREFGPKQFLFEKDGVGLSENSLRYMVTKLFKKVGIKVTPHQLRHSYATVLLNNNARIADVSELLGHASMATTQIYTKLSSTLKMENYQNAHPLCRDDDAK
ncbi:MAG: integrase [Helicobacteraceae bacterium 4484_230]|nr:MAG: integrase [Helicobacteraceae bacterium 4484_230]